MTHEAAVGIQNRGEATWFCPDAEHYIPITGKRATSRHFVPVQNNSDFPSSKVKEVKNEVFQ